MRSLRAFLLRLAAPFTGSRGDAEFRDELESHLQLHIDDGIRAGLTPAEARRDAMLKLGGVTQTIERQRDRRGLPSLDGLVRDFRHAVRVLLHMPGFTAAALIVLALGNRREHGHFQHRQHRPCCAHCPSPMRIASCVSGTRRRRSCFPA
jgi:hypothetical protein